jgi:hypothetical protein
VKEHSKSRTAGKDSYKLTSTVMLWLETNKDGSGMMQLGGSLTRQDEREMQYDESAHPHIANIGVMIEEMENKMRSTLNQIYFGKTKDIVNDLRSVESGDLEGRLRLMRRSMPVFAHAALHIFGGFLFHFWVNIMHGAPKKRDGKNE